MHLLILRFVSTTRPNYRRLNPKADFGYGHPLPVPTSTSLPIRVRSYPNIYQGRRLPGDERVYAKAFNNTALPSGQLYHCEAFFDCIVTHLSVETKGSVPILLRGGVGYNYMHVVVRAHPNIQLNGNIRAFCKKKKTEAARTRQKTANDAEQGDK